MGLSAPPAAPTGHRTASIALRCTRTRVSQDENFGTAIQCGSAGTWQKDTLSLPDVNYGHNGSWTMSVWFRHDTVNYPGYQREQFIGHGDPIAPTSSRNQFHVQLERSTNIRTILRDGSDIDRCAPLPCTTAHQPTVRPRPCTTHITATPSGSTCSLQILCPT